MTAVSRMRVVSLLFLLLPAPAVASVQYLQSWGSLGSDQGQFDTPTDVAVDDSGFVYVLDNRNRRVQKFTADGTYLLTWGGLSSPHGISYDPSGSILIANTGIGQIARYSTSGDLLDRMGNKGSGDGEFLGPRGVAAARDGTIYVADTFNDRIQALSPSGTFLWALNGINRPTGIVVSPEGLLYVSESTSDRVSIFTPSGVPVDRFGVTGHGPGELQFPNGLAASSNGKILVADIQNYRIQVFNADGSFLLKWGGPGPDAGFFNRPRGVAVRGDTVFVADTDNNRIQKFRVTELSSTPPEIVLAFAPTGGSTAYVRYSKSMPSSAADPARYLVQQTTTRTSTIPVLSASRDGDLVVLDLSVTVPPRTKLTVTATGIADDLGLPLVDPGPHPVFTDNVLSGIHFSDLHLRAADPGPTYYVVGDLYLQAGTTFTIDPGVTLRMLSKHDILNGGVYPSLPEIQAQGTVLAVGSRTDSIRVMGTSPTPRSIGAWGEIRFEGSGNAVFKYCSISEAVTAFRSTGPKSLDIADCTIADIAGDAVALAEGSIAISDTRFTNVLVGRGVYASHAAVDIRNSEFVSIAEQAIHLEFCRGLVRSNSIRSAAGFRAPALPKPPAIHIRRSAVQLSWNRVAESGGAGISVTGPVGSARLLGNTVHTSEAEGILFTSSFPGTVEACEVFDCAGDGITVSVPAGGLVTNNLAARCFNGIRSATSNPLVMKYLTVVDAVQDGITLNGSPSDLTDCIVVGSGRYGVTGTNVAATVNYMDVWDSHFAPYHGVTCSFGCYGLDPGFVDVVADDYHLTPESVFRFLGEADDEMGRYGPHSDDVTGNLPGDAGNHAASRLLRIAPNPLRDHASLYFASPSKTTASLRLFDLRGRLVGERKDIPISEGENTLRLNRASVAAGIYFVQVRAPRWQRRTKVVIVD